ncbi:hypothetical protein ABFT80_11175 [Mesorhizobium sp. SB112]|uniref:hypothetical protein n=1 Tax=Mesorhizobium sp. SB112 TaxID=3151853 RepID=UPI003266EF71
MDPKKTPDPAVPEDEALDAPTIAEQDWEAIEGGEILPDSVSENGDIRYDVEKSGELPEEDEDNAYQNSDEALPDDQDEKALKRNPSKEGGRFDEV